MGARYSKPDWQPTVTEALFEQATLLDPQERYGYRLATAAGLTVGNNRKGYWDRFGALLHYDLLDFTGETVYTGGRRGKLFTITTEGAEYALEHIEARVEELTLVRDALQSLTENRQ